MLNKNRRDYRFTESPVLKTHLSPSRPRIVFGLIFFAFALLLGRAFYLQLIAEKFLQDQGDIRYRRVMDSSASRGSVLDRNGNILAQSTPMVAVWVNNAADDLSKEDIKKLSELLELDPKVVTKKINLDKNFVVLKHHVAMDVAAEVAALKLPGVLMDKEYSRFYPSREMTAHVVGFTNQEDVGLEGVELAYNQILTGSPGRRTVIKDRRGQIVEEIGSTVSPTDGQDIHLSIDSKIQFIAYNALRNAVDAFSAKGGSAIVVDAKTGEVLALVNEPTYNPNSKTGKSPNTMRNRALVDSFEPGSTMKPFIAAMALDSGKYKPETMVNCGEKLVIGPATVSDAHPHGMLSVAQVIQKSSNIGAARMALRFSPDEMYGMFTSAGFGSQPKLGFPGEVGGKVRAPKTWRPIEQATMSYGHGLSVSVVQLVKAYTVFANNGNVIDLTLIKREDDSPPNMQRVFSEKSANQLLPMLESVVSAEGTAKKAEVVGYRVGGKTGTAHKIEHGQYVKKYVSSFIGLGPISSPKLIIGVVIDEPSGAHYGGDVAAPVFAQIMGESLRTLGISQDKEIPPEKTQKMIENEGFKP